MATSVALLIDTLGVTPAYCSGKTGCHAAKLAARRALGPVPLPLVGLIAFWVWLGVTTLTRGRWSRWLQATTALVAATSALGLLGIQAFTLKSFCPFCVTVDVAAIAAAALLLIAGRLERGGASPQWLHPIALVGLGIVTSAAPVAWPHIRPATAVPAQLMDYAVPDRVTIVEFVDLGCGHCRELYPTLERLRHEQSRRIHFVRLHVPNKSHHRARDAARLIQCLLPDESRAEMLTKILFESQTLERSALIGAAESVGMSEEEAAACWDDPASGAPIEANVRLLEALGFQGLPTTYVGGERIVGAQPGAVYQAALDRVQRSRGSTNLQGWAFYVLVGMIFLGIVVVGRRGRANPRSGGS